MSQHKIQQKYRRLVLLLCTGLFCCVQLMAEPENAVTTQPRTDKSEQLKNHAGSGAYVLRSNDLIRITVFQEDDLTTETRISKAGNITFPLLGSLKVEGKTEAAVTEEIRALLDRDYVINPQVSITVLEYAKQRVTVLGQVQKPGTMEIPTEGNLDLLGLIAMAGGYTRIADPARITVRRLVDGKDVVLQVNAKDLARDKNVKPFLILPGDTVSVAESMF